LNDTEMTVTALKLRVAMDLEEHRETGTDLRELVDDLLRHADELRGATAGKSSAELAVWVMESDAGGSVVEEIANILVYCL
jgi:hypothetical protein